MNVVINTSVLVTTPTGVGTYVYEAARALREAGRAHRYTYYDGRYSDRLPEKGDSPQQNKVGTVPLFRRVKAMLDRVPPARALARRVAHGMHRISARKRAFDLYWEPNYIPLPIDAARRVVTVHDLSVVTHPEWHPKDRVAYFARHFVTGLERADVVTADSEFTRGELLALGRLDPARVRVVYPGCDLERFRPRGPRENRDRPQQNKGGTAPIFPERFVLVVGAVDPRKNVSRLLDAWAMLPPALRRETRLVLTGFTPTHRTNPALMEKVRALGDEVISLGYLGADDLACAYASATALAYPSLYEGFGLPALEAMASGCPVVASGIPPVREVCGNAAEFVDPAGTKDMAAGLHRVLESDARRHELMEKGLARAQSFTWSATARALLEAFDAAAQR